MKKLLILILVLSFTSTFFAQDAEDKQFLAGLTIGGALDFNNTQTKTMDAKTGGDFVVGMAIDWSFTKNIGLASGLEFDFNSFKTSYNNKVYFDYDDKNILRFKDTDFDNEGDYFRLQDRKHSSIYLSLPVMLKFQTGFMGYMRYYGKFGVRNSFLLTTKTHNEGVGYNSNDKKNGETELNDMKSKGVMSFYKGAVGIAGGAEYNITGSTVLVAELGYYYGFTEIYQQKGSLFGDDEKSMSLYETNKKGEREYYAPKLKQGQLLLKISVLF